MISIIHNINSKLLHTYLTYLNTTLFKVNSKPGCTKFSSVCSLYGIIPVSGSIKGSGTPSSSSDSLAASLSFQKSSSAWSSESEELSSHLSGISKKFLGPLSCFSLPLEMVVRFYESRIVNIKF